MEFDEIYEYFDKSKQEYDKEEYIQCKREEKDEVYQLIDTTAEKIVTNGNQFKQYLDVQSNFEGYSVGNALLVKAQMPQATELKDRESWKKRGEYLVKSPKKVKILEPRR